MFKITPSGYYENVLNNKRNLDSVQKDAKETIDYLVQDCEITYEPN